MTESTPSSQVAVVSLLPAATIGDPYTNSTGDIVVPWTNNDDFTQIGENTSSTDTDFVDGNVPEDGEKYEYVVTSYS